MLHLIARSLEAFAAGGQPRILMVTHAWGGGVEEQVRRLRAVLQPHARVALLRPDDQGRTDCAHLELPDGAQIALDTSDWPSLVAALSQLEFARIHVHHTQGWPPEILDLAAALAIPLDVFVHDYGAICPQYHCAQPDGRYCGEPDDTGCNTCIAGRPHAWQRDIAQWRAGFGRFLGTAKRIYVPSLDVERRLQRYFPALQYDRLPQPSISTVTPAIVKVALIGALSPIKGLSVAMAVAKMASQANSALRLRLIGHAAEPLPAGFTATGSYEPHELRELVAIERPDVIWLPSQVPETFSLTLSVAMATGLPIVASNLGAFPERLADYESATLVAHDASAATWYSALLEAGNHQGSSQRQPLRSTGRDAADEGGAASVTCFTGELPPEVGAAAADRLASLALSAGDQRIRSAGPDRALLDLFRIGVHGGHRDSRRTVELALESLAPGETHIVGRSQYEAATAELDSTRAELQLLQREYDESRQTYQGLLDEAEQRALAARQHIKHLETTQKQLQAELGRQENLRQEIIASTSWRVTYPLRAVGHAAKRARRIANVTRRLITQAPTLLPRGIAQFRRGGWSRLRDRLAAEFRQPDRSRPVVAAPDAPRAITPLSVASTHELPKVSIIIPVYGQHLVTFACLSSIAEHAPACRFEVIVMDDHSPEPASDALAAVAGVRFIRNDVNEGFVGNVNAATKAARGEWLIILNNDTVVCANAFDSMLRTFEQHANVGLVGAKLLNTDGSLQEAGGIVWRDGSAWNWGRNEDRHDPRFNFVRDADYCSGAALAISRELYQRLGGFDPVYSPAYYEDTDLAFRVRAAGLRVLYQPAAEIFHLEGVSHGRDENAGLKAFQRINADKFFARWQSTLASHRENGDQPEQEAHRQTSSNILIVEACMLVPDQDSGSVRMFNIMKLLRAEGHHVTYLAANLDGDPKYVSILTSEGIEVLHGTFAGSVRQVLARRGPSLDFIVFCRHYIAAPYIDSVRSLAPRAKIVFDTVDLHFLREEREAAVKESPAMRRAAAATRERELRVMAQSDVTLVVSDIEAGLLQRIQPTANVRIVTNVHHAAPSITGWQQRSGILFVGGFRHPPNVDAVHWYASEVLPAVRQLLPDVVTTIVGSNMPAELLNLAQPGLDIAGFVPDLEPLLQGARVSIAPLRFGAGVKGKINEAMNHGIPVVATTCAIEAMHLQPGIDVLVADEAHAFARAIADAYNDAALWSTLSEAGLRNVRQHFSVHAVLPVLREVFSRKAQSPVDQTKAA